MGDVDVKKFKELINQNDDLKVDNDVVVLDVRTLGEFENGFIKGAINYDIHEINFRDDILKLDREKTYLVYCRSGARSFQAMSFMKQNNFKSVFNLVGGTIAWNLAGEELVEENE